MRKLISVLCFAWIVVATGYAQQDPQYTHNAFDKLSVNPGYAGLNDRFCGTMILRRQWAGLNGGPETGLINLSAPSSIGGVGISYYNDKLGQEKNHVARLSYSYPLILPKGKLGIGAAVGIMNKTLGADWIATDGWLDDPVIPDAGTSASTYDLTFGLFYMLPGKMYVGLSSTHLTANSLSQMGVDLARHYYLQAGYQFNVSPDWTLLPSVFAKSDAASTQIDVNARLVWKNKFWGGVSYRMQAAIAPMFGVQGELPNGTWQAGYSYDVGTNNLASHHNGSHELMVKFCLDLKKCDCTRYRDVRFMGTSDYERRIPLPPCCYR